MRPERTRDTSHRAATARGRMFLKARLDWVPGFPVGQGRGYVTWMKVPRAGNGTPEIVRLDRQHIRRATYTWNKLVRRFPRALSRVVEDGASWKQVLPQLLDWLKSPIHRDQKLVSSPLEVEGAFPAKAVKKARALAARNARLGPLVSALAWSEFLTPTRLAEALSWLEPNAEKLLCLLEELGDQQGRAVALSLWMLAREDGARRVQPLVNLLGDSRLHRLHTLDPDSYVSAWSRCFRAFGRKKGKKPPKPELPAPDMASRPLAFLAWLGNQNQATRRKTLDLFALVVPPDLLPRWGGWWRKVSGQIKSAQKLLSERLTPGIKRQTERTAQQLDRLNKKLPPRPHFERLLYNVRKAADPENAEFYARACAVLELLPNVIERSAVRAAFLNHWIAVKLHYEHQVCPLLKEFRRALLRHQDVPGFLDPWKKILYAWRSRNPSGHWGLTEQLFDSLADRSRWPALFDAIAICCLSSKKPVSEIDAERLADLMVLTRDPEEAVLLFFDLLENCPDQYHVWDEVLSCSYKLDRGAGRFGKLAAVLQKISASDYRACDMMSVAAECLDTAGWPGMTADLVLDGDTAELIRAARQWGSLKALRGSAPPLRRVRKKSLRWPGHYPKGLRPALRILGRAAPDARRLASAALDRYFPDPKELETQAEAIRQRLRERPGNEGLATRLRNLKTRIASPTAPTPARLKKLADKLEKSARKTVFRAWSDGIDDELSRRLCELLEAAEPPRWALTRKHIQVIGAILQLPAEFRELGRRLLRLRCGPPPWNMLDHPANQAFLARMRRQGMDPDPWANPGEPCEFTGKKGQKVYLALETDPLEILHMGRYFQTCLSPGNDNFFSTVANALDVNKQVIYARDKQGKVVGRCLLAVSQEGGLLTFEPYCHDGSLGFQEMVAEFAGDLATRMNTALAARGRVQPLVAPDWYDDGPRDLGGRFPFLKEKSAFRKRLANIAPQEFPAALEKELAPLPINAMTLTPVIWLDELLQRPELILPLLPRIRELRWLSDVTRLRAGYLAHRSGNLDFARRTLRQYGIPWLLNRNRHFGLDEGTMIALIQLEPPAALRVLRRTRPKGVRSDEDEQDGLRRDLLARAHEALGRPAQAERLRGT